MRQVRFFLFLILMSFSITVAAQTTEFPTVEYQTDKDAVISKVRIMSTSTIVSVRVQGHGKGSWIEISPYTYLCFLYGSSSYQYPIRALSDGVKALSLGQKYYMNDYSYYTIDLIFDKIPLGCNVITVQEMDGWLWSGIHINNPG